jgi:hypothetical protein
MRLKPLLLQGVISCAFGIGSASASLLTVYLMAHVTAIDDSSGILGGQVTVGQVAGDRHSSWIYQVNVHPAYQLGSERPARDPLPGCGAASPDGVNHLSGKCT